MLSPNKIIAKLLTFLKIAFPFYIILKESYNMPLPLVSKGCNADHKKDSCPYCRIVCF